VNRTRSPSHPRLLTRPFTLLLGTCHFILPSRQFHNLHTRVGAEL
jgi:hypothetical protein